MSGWLAWEHSDDGGSDGRSEQMWALPGSGLHAVHGYVWTLTGSTGYFLADCLGFSAKRVKRRLFWQKPFHWKFNEDPVRLISFSCERGGKRYVGCFRQISIWHGGVSSRSAAPEDSHKQMSLSTYDIKALAGMMGTGTVFLRGFTHN